MNDPSTPGTDLAPNTTRETARTAARSIDTALRAAGVRPLADFDARDIRVTDGGVRIGDIHAEDVLTLGETLHGGSWDEALDLDDWHHLERLAELLAPVLCTATGGVVTVDPQPACNRCSRPYEMTLGCVTAGQAHRLADAVEASAISTLPPADSRHRAPTYPSRRPTQPTDQPYADHLAASSDAPPLL